MLSSFLLRLNPVVSCIMTGRGLTVTFARVLARAPVDAPDFPPTDTLNHSLSAKSVLSCPLWPCLPACVSSPSGAVSVGSHMHQDMRYVLGASTSQLADRSRQQPRSKNRRQFHPRRGCFRYVLQRVFNVLAGRKCKAVWEFRLDADRL